MVFLYDVSEKKYTNSARVDTELYERRMRKLIWAD